MLTELNILKFYGILLVVLGHVVFTYSPMSIITPSTPSPILNSVKKGDLRFSHASVYLCQRMYLRLAIGGKKEIYDFCTIV